MGLKHKVLGNDFAGVQQGKDEANQVFEQLSNGLFTKATRPNTPLAANLRERKTHCS
jgi:hypothetical protein